MNEKSNYFAIIPAEVRYDKDLRPNEKLLYGEITALTKQTGECWASNNYFSELYNVKSNAIAVWIRHLKEKGYIDIEYKYKGKEIQQRIIKIGGIQKDSTWYSKEYGGSNKKIVGGIQKDKENNIIINNININNKKENVKRKRFFDDENLNNIFIEFLDLRKKLNAVNTDRAINSLLKKLESYNDDIKYKMIEQSIIYSWKGIFEYKPTKEEIKKQKELEIEKWLMEEENE